MERLAEFNPYVVDLYSGTLQENALERMCMWYEIELITHASNDGGVYTYDQFINAQPGRIFIRRPGMIVQGISSYTYFGILFDARYDASLEDFYKIGIASLSAKYDPKFLNKLLSNDHFFNFIDDICPYVDIQDFDWYYRRFDEMYHLSFERPPLYHLHAKSILLAILSKLYCDIKLQPKFNIMENPCYHELLQIRK